jgi:signal transduction histidine kinase
MGIFLNNGEFRTAVGKLGFVFIFGLALLILLSVFFLGVVNTGVTRESESMAGLVLKNHPELEAEIVKAVTQGYSGESAAAGAAALQKYGYGEALGLFDQPSLKLGLEPVFLGIAGFMLVLFTASFFTLRAEYKKIYRKIQTVTGSADKVVEGDIATLNDEGEGDFCKLGHSFNRMAETVRASMRSSAAEKQFLRNAIADISHQIKTPLSSVLVFNELMLSDDAMEEKTRGDFLLKTRSQLLRIQWLVESLLKMAMLESGTIGFQKKKANIREILEKAVLPIRALSMSKGVAIRAEAPDGDAAAICDDKWTVEAIANIVKNAVEHTPPGGEVKVTAESTGLFAKIRIADNGEGIAEKDLPHIFERFYRGGGTPGAESVGVGLSLSRLIVEGQGGLISVRSEVGKGTEFEIALLHGFGK